MALCASFDYLIIADNMSRDGELCALPINSLFPSLSLHTLQSTLCVYNSMYVCIMMFFQIEERITQKMIKKKPKEEKTGKRTKVLVPLINF